MHRQYEGVDDIILTIDGLQPEKGHETLYVVRELTQKRVWFAEPLLSATAPEVQRLIAQAKQWAEILGKRVILWVSDKQDAFVTGIAAEFPEVPHRYCDNHFLRDAAKPVLDADSHAKVQMRKKVRGLRGIERSVLKQQRRQRIKEESQALPQSSNVIEAVNADNALFAEEEPAGDVILEYCAWFGAFSTTIRVGRFIRPVCGWRRLWVRFGTRSSETWTRKKGVSRGATQPPGRLHRQGPGRGET